MCCSEENTAGSMREATTGTIFSPSSVSSSTALPALYPPVRKMRCLGRGTGEGMLAMPIFHSGVCHISLPSSAETPTTPLFAQYRYIRWS